MSDEWEWSDDTIKQGCGQRIVCYKLPYYLGTWTIIIIYLYLPFILLPGGFVSFSGCGCIQYTYSKLLVRLLPHLKNNYVCNRNSSSRGIGLEMKVPSASFITNHSHKQSVKGLTTQRDYKLLMRQFCP